MRYFRNKNVPETDSESDSNVVSALSALSEVNVGDVEMNTGNPGLDLLLGYFFIRPALMVYSILYI